MRSSRTLRALAVLGGALFGSVLPAGDVARANGRMASANQLVASPTDPNLLVMEATVGILVSHDMGGTFGWLCEAAVGYGDGGPQDPSMGITPKYVIAGLRQGLSLSADQGCSWKFALPDPVVDVVVRKDDPHTVLALTSAFSGVGDGGQNVYATKVLASHDDGDTWAQLGVAIDPSIAVETIEIAQSDVNRIYIGGYRLLATADAGVERVGAVMISTNGGTTYSETDIPLLPPTETKYAAAYVSAVDPHNPDLVYVRIGDTLVDRLLVSRDGAKTFSMAYQATGALLGFALSDDGTKAFVGGPFDGVLMANVAADAAPPLSFVKQSATDVSCLSWISGGLDACVRIPGNAFYQYLGVSTDDGVTFAPKFHLGCVEAPLSCPGSSLATECAAALTNLGPTVGPCAEGGLSDAAAEDADAATPSDAAASDALADKGDASGTLVGVASTHSGCGCNAGEAAGAASGVSISMIGLGLVFRRRRRPG